MLGQGDRGAFDPLEPTSLAGMPPVMLMYAYLFIIRLFYFILIFYIILSHHAPTQRQLRPTRPSRPSPLVPQRLIRVGTI